MNDSGTGQRHRDRRREQRRIARAHHPDLGGDAVQYAQLMREVDLRFGARPEGFGPNRATTTPISLVEVRPRPGARLRGSLRAGARIVRALRSRLPRRVPGARRYIDL